MPRHPPALLSLTEALERGRTTRQQLAAELGVDPSTVWRWASTDPAYTATQPTAAQLAQMAKVLRLSPRPSMALARWFEARRSGGAQ